jgi:4-hydroxy-tetrahydrodipicolinate synthase
MCDNSTNPGKQEDVTFIQAALTKTEDIIGQDYPLSAKYFLKKRGVPIEISSRVNPDALTTSQKQALDDVYTHFVSWCDRIGIKPVTI